MSFRATLLCLTLVSFCGCVATPQVADKAMFDFEQQQKGSEPPVEETKSRRSGQQCSKSSLTGTKPVVSALCQ